VRDLPCFECVITPNSRSPIISDSLSPLPTMPTGTSKWYPIEHRLFSEISKNWAGEPLDSYRKILNFIHVHQDRALRASRPPPVSHGGLPRKS
jgi:hypothetical protein